MIKALSKIWGESLKYHQWIAFKRTPEDKSEFAEPEAFIEFKDCILLLECKLTGGPFGQAQMQSFYAKLLLHIFKKPVRCLQICKNVTPSTPGPFFASIESFLASGETYGTWHNLRN